MKKYKKVMMIAATILFLFTFTFHFNGCSKDNPLSPTISDAPSGQMMSLAKSNGNQNGIQKATDTGRAYGKKKQQEKLNSYPQYAHKTLTFDIEAGAYTGGTMRVDNGTLFHVNGASFTPPEGTPAGESVTITMKVEKIGREKDEQLIFTFGPSGSNFAPAGVIRMNWKDLSGTKPPNFYYIDDAGNYILQRPDYVDKKRKNTYAHIEHFSRYALAHSE